MKKINISDDMVDSLSNSLAGSNEDFDLAEEIINNANVAPKTRQNLNKIKSKVATNLIFKQCKQQEIWIIELNGKMAKFNNTGNGFYKSKRGASNALSIICNEVVIDIKKRYWGINYINNIVNSIKSKKYRNPKEKGNLNYLYRNKTDIELNQIKFLHENFPTGKELKGFLFKTQQIEIKRIL